MCRESTINDVTVNKHLSIQIINGETNMRETYSEQVKTALDHYLCTANVGSPFLRHFKYLNYKMNAWTLKKNKS